jgi:hypothetical protein
MNVALRAHLQVLVLVLVLAPLPLSSMSGTPAVPSDHELLPRLNAPCSAAARDAETLSRCALSSPKVVATQSWAVLMPEVERRLAAMPSSALARTQGGIGRVQHAEQSQNAQSGEVNAFKPGSVCKSQAAIAEGSYPLRPSSNGRHRLSGLARGLGPPVARAPSRRSLAIC